jgi:hypothetical protein
MKNLWIIPIVVLSVFACSETKEKPLTPIYADAFYEPDFIPYLMLKHGVDTIKGFYDREITSAYLRRIDPSEAAIIHSFNPDKLIYVEQSTSSIGDVVWFNKDSLIWIERKGGWDVNTHYQFSHNRVNDTVFMFVEDYQFSVLGKNYDSIVRFENKHGFIIDSTNGIECVFNKGQLIYRLNIGAYHPKSTYKYNQLGKMIYSSLEERESIEEKPFSYLRKEYSWINESDFVIKESYQNKSLSKTIHLKIIYFQNYLPVKEEYYFDDTVSLVINYQIIRNAKK